MFLVEKSNRRTWRWSIALQQHYCHVFSKLQFPFTEASFPWIGFHPWWNAIDYRATKQFGWWKGIFWWHTHLRQHTKTTEQRNSERSLSRQKMMVQQRPITSLDSRMHALIVAWRHVFALDGWVCVVRELFANLVFCSIPSVNQHFSGGMQIYSTSFLSVYLPTYLQSNLSIYRSVDFSVCLSVCLFCLFCLICPSVRPSVHPSTIRPSEWIDITNLNIYIYNIISNHIRSHHII